MGWWLAGYVVAVCRFQALDLRGFGLQVASSHVAVAVCSFLVNGGLVSDCRLLSLKVVALGVV